MTKFIPTFIGVTQNPIIIIGDKPGKTRDNSTQALQGNRIGDFVDEAIAGRKNIILTNIVNLLYPGPFRRDIGLDDGIIDLIKLIETYQPSKIITLGSYAEEYVKSIKTECKVVNLRHPSWVNRFHPRLHGEYIKLLSNEFN